MISVETYRDQGLVHPDVIVRVTSQYEVAFRNACTPKATKKIIEAIEMYGHQKALPEQIFAPYQHDSETLPWLVEKLNQLPTPETKVDRIFTDHWLYWSTFCPSELASQFADQLGKTKLAKAVENHSEHISDLRFTATLAGKDAKQTLSILNKWVNELHELELEPNFEKTKLDAMTKHIAHQGGAGSDLLNKHLKLRPNFDAYEPSLEEIQVQVVLALLAADGQTPVDLDAILYWLEITETSQSAHYALRSRMNKQTTENLIDQFHSHPKNTRSELTTLLSVHRDPALREKIWNLYEQENDFEVLGDITSILVAYGGEDFEIAAMEMFELDGVDFADSLKFKIYTNRVLSGKEFADRKEWQEQLSGYFELDHIHAELNYEIDPDPDLDTEYNGMFDDEY